MSKFTLAVVIPNYNNSKYIAECINSVINQTYQELKEIIVVDDASTDSSRQIIFQIASTDDRVKLVALEKNGGVSRARNKGLSIVTSEYVTFLDGDDYYYNNNKLKNEMELVKKYALEGMDIIAYSAIMRVSSKGEIVIKKDIEDADFLVGNIYRKLLSSITLEKIMRDYCVKVDMIRNVNGYNENRCFFEDYELILKLSREALFYCTLQYGTAYRESVNGLSNRTFDEQIDTINEIALNELKQLGVRGLFLKIKRLILCTMIKMKHKVACFIQLKK